MENRENQHGQNSRMILFRGGGSKGRSGVHGKRQTIMKEWILNAYKGSGGVSAMNSMA
jgi:hypothetical protein